MKDLTQGSIPRHVVEMAVPMGIGMLVQTLYFLVDLYFVGRLGEVALAGVSAAGNTMFVIIATTQMLGVGTLALIAHAVGRKDREDANLLFNQSLLLAAVLAAATLAAGYLVSDAYLRAIAAGEATVAAGQSYLYWYLPGMALQFPLVAMGSALRGTGIVKPTMIVQMLTVLLNVILAPILIAGWLIGRPLGVAGAGLATTLSVAAGVVLLLFGFMAVIYWAISGFGATAQAGFGLGGRMMQAIFLPAMALAFAAPAVAGQNFGARLPDRVRHTFRWTAVMSSIVMLCLTLICQVQPSLLVRGFSTDPDVQHVAATFLRYISWNFVPTALIFTCSGLFQALGNTWPALLSTATRIVTFVLPVVWVSQQQGFEIEDVWILSVTAVAIQAVISYLLLKREFGRKLGAAPVMPAPSPG